MTLHRPTNLMGTAACHEAGEHLANPIAAGTRPLTAEERADIRGRHERAQKLVEKRPLYQMLADVTRRATQESLKRRYSVF